MATTRSALTDEDVRSLVKGATSDERALAARKLCATMDRGPLSDADRALAGDILRVMAADAAELVRTAIAETLRSSSVVPRDVALRLARDVELVSLPMLACSRMTIWQRSFGWAAGCARWPSPNAPRFHGW